MAAIAHSIDSFLQRLESAKNLFRSEMYGEAADSFQDLLRAALPGAPDVFIAAVYGLAECQRLSRNFGAAADNYQALLTRYCSSPSLWAGGRLAESNRSLALQA